LTIRAVIFDLGHTIWDIRRDEATLARAYVEMRKTLAQRTRRDDLPDAARLQRAVRDVLRGYVETYENSDDLSQPATYTFVDEAFRTLALELPEAVLIEITGPLFATEIDGLVCKDGTCEAIGALADDGYSIGCVTNTLAGGPAIREMLRRFELESLMRSVVVSAEEGWRKPHRSLFDKALREVDVAPDEAVFVGDSPTHDIAGAQAAGMRAVLTQQYVARPWEPFGVMPDATIRHVRELAEVIRRLDAVAV